MIESMNQNMVSFEKMISKLSSAIGICLQIANGQEYYDDGYYYDDGNYD